MIPNRTTFFSLVVPITFSSIFILTLASNVGNIQDNISNLISTIPQAFAYYNFVATVSVAIMGFLIVALPLISQLFSGDKLAGLLKPFVRRGGVQAVLTYIVITIVFAMLSLILSSSTILLGQIQSLFSFSIVSCFFITAFAFLGSAMYTLYYAIKATNPQLVGMKKSEQKQEDRVPAEFNL
jgi:hypothetical protein